MEKCVSRQSLSPHRCGGNAYVMVLAISMIVTVIGLSAVMATRIERRTFESAFAVSTARNYAQSGIELALLKISQDVNWRQTYTHDTWVADQTIGGGTFRWKLVDQADTDLNNNEIDPARLVVWGMTGGATQKVSVLIEPSGAALSSLSAAAHAKGNVSLAGSFDTITVTGAPLSTNAVLDNQGTINGDVDANSITGSGTVNGTVNTPASPKDVPNTPTVFEYYIANGTPIAFASLPPSFGTGSIENVVLSPANNPWGSANPSGVYVIDCQGNRITIRNCRIVGTLVLLNPSIFSDIGQSISWEPAVSNYPALLVQGSITIAPVNTGLDEAATANFNPVGTPYPYPSGTEDADQNDVYPSQITGLIYASGWITLGRSAIINGVVVTEGEIWNLPFLADTFSLTYMDTFFNNPPPGFTAGPGARIVPGTWRQEVD